MNTISGLNIHSFITGALANTVAGPGLTAV